MVGKRFFYIALGIFATGVALIGVFLPGIPTTFPLIVALWAFSKSSERLYEWLGSLPVLKHALTEVERFERERSIDWRVKVISSGSAWVSAVAVAVLTRSLIVTSFVVFSALACTAFMIYIPTRQPAVDTIEEE